MPVVHRSLLAAACLSIGFGVTSAPILAAEPAPTYSDVLAALQTGKTVKILSDLGQCLSANGGKAGPSIRGGLQINSFIVTTSGNIAFSDVHQTLDRAGKSVTEYIRYNLSTDGKTTINVARQAGGEIVQQDEFVCQSPAGVKFIW